MFTYTTGSGKLFIDGDTVIIKKRPLLKKFVTTKNIAEFTKINYILPDIAKKKHGFIKFFYEGCPAVPKAYPQYTSVELNDDISLIVLYYSSFDINKFQEVMTKLSDMARCKITDLGNTVHHQTTQPQQSSNANSETQSAKQQNKSSIWFREDIDQLVRVINDSCKIINETKSPDVFFSRYALIMSTGRKLIDVESEMKLDTSKMSNALMNAINTKQKLIRQFIERYLSSVTAEAENLKTDIAKQRRYKKFYDSLKVYEDEMDVENINFFASQYKKLTKAVYLEPSGNIQGGTEYSAGNLILLKYLHNIRVNERLPAYFSFTYNLDTEKCIKEFWSDGLIEYASFPDTLDHCTVTQLKGILTKHELPVSGNKPDLIKRIVDGTDNEKIFSELDKYIVLTDAGKKIVEDNLSDEEYYNRYVKIKQTLSDDEKYIQCYNKALAELQSAKKTAEFLPYYYTVRTKKDSSVCEYCKSFENKESNINNAVVGINYPPFRGCTCKVCRCFTTHEFREI